MLGVPRTKFYLAGGSRVTLSLLLVGLPIEAVALIAPALMTWSCAAVIDELHELRRDPTAWATDRLNILDSLGLLATVMGVSLAYASVDEQLAWLCDVLDAGADEEEGHGEPSAAGGAGAGAARPSAVELATPALLGLGHYIGLFSRVDKFVPPGFTTSETLKLAMRDESSRRKLSAMAPSCPPR